MTNAGLASSNGPQVFPSGTERRVCDDIAARQAHGFKKYGTTVESNPIPLRAWLQHAYEETLDQAIYLRRAIEEIDENEKAPRRTLGALVGPPPP